MPDQPIDHAGLEPLSFDACLELLASVHLGRIGFHADGELVILPVNHAMDGQDVVFRTSGGSKLAAAGEQGLVAFEVDAYDQETRSGWSVLVTGRAWCTTTPRSSGSASWAWITGPPACARTGCGSGLPR
jgi:nitroimidazol reductase NimA-like FMN-containing flavoprotein (pyridoxamine 5'-phosphate oxidase superfamily)